jgi:hypothetical protein
VLHNGKATFFYEKSTGSDLAHVSHPAIPLSPVFYKFNGLREHRKAVQAGDCKEYGKLVPQLFLKLTVISHKLLFKHPVKIFYSRQFYLLMKEDTV